MTAVMSGKYKESHGFNRGSMSNTKMQTLSEMPQRIKTIDEEPWGSYGFRKIRIKNYYIYFWINEKKKQVQIIAVIYVKMDQVKQLEKMILDDGK